MSRGTVATETLGAGGKMVGMPTPFDIWGWSWSGIWNGIPKFHWDSLGHHCPKLEFQVCYGGLLHLGGLQQIGWPIVDPIGHNFVWGHYFVIPPPKPPCIHGWEPPWPHGGPLLGAPWEPTVLFGLHCNPMKGPFPWTKFDGGQGWDFLVSCCQTQPFQNKMAKSFFIKDLKIFL